jgi:hypothetical protein
VVRGWLEVKTQAELENHTFVGRAPTQIRENLTGAIRSTGTKDKNVAFASEVELDGKASADGGFDEDDGAEGSASDAAEAG